ncbi:DUF6522 family protein [Sandarakinorhabdus sp. DWP1-3-1]|uniref:DUF6522 family protein n=1 Tax=Sandarakinorhabdus sp. DWP1-3-1 TaxID=2804627 RepID=UPI003CF79819
MIEIDNDGFTVAAEVIAEGLKLAPADIQPMLKAGIILSATEAGVDEDLGTFRLTFSTRHRRLRLVVDALGGVLSSSVLDFGEQPLPPASRRPARSEVYRRSGAFRRPRPLNITVLS